VQSRIIWEGGRNNDTDFSRFHQVSRISIHRTVHHPITRLVPTENKHYTETRRHANYFDWDSRPQAVLQWHKAACAFGLFSTAVVWSNSVHNWVRPINHFTAKPSACISIRGKMSVCQSLSNSKLHCGLVLPFWHKRRFRKYIDSHQSTWQP
jgi:hypothetical protein